jgi:spore germination cell wall hydrolase CwlJ-like protein
MSFARLRTLTARADPSLLSFATGMAANRGSDLADRSMGWETLDIAHAPTLGLGSLGAEAARRVNGFIPVTDRTIGPAAPFYLQAQGPERERALLCLTQAIYYEAALEPDAGQAAVAQTVINRLRHPAFPHTICGVVYQGVALGLGCQFTFACDGARDRKPVPSLWRRAQQAAERAVNGYVMAQVGSATSYHADYVYPSWGPTLIKIGQIGAHIFYRFPGPAGLPDALRQAYRGDELSVSLSVAQPVVTLVSNVTTPPGQYFYVNPRAAEAPRRPAPGDIINGRRVPTPEEIAHINAALLEMERFSQRPAAPIQQGE